ncbi:NAD(P)-binding domain-containing protein [Rhodocytophaga aerolata]|uniref:NAD(P)-binding domain-containing protein n=1 Tax=Rhodocytophaga aerolata TaxID=455078 RepID=A0ABT8RFL5_9BACT|nr:NAD(P)-binding domain-containing protein [Rhodocytophaga aerolata]MDO1450870.1 NAD(P)-binding domain-containing protein [Rhodocytophaga aerolata]
MKIAIIGTGRMGKALLNTFYKVYPNEILFAGRDITHTQQVINELGLNLQAVSLEVAMQAEVIIPTLWFADVQPWVQERAMALQGKILIDITNPFNETYEDFTTPYDTSSAEIIQQLIPHTYVVGAFKNTYWVVFDNPVLQGLKSDVYVTANKEEVRKKVMRLLEPLPFRILDAGTLKNNRTIERMTLLSRELSLKAGNYPRIAFNLWGLEHSSISG